MGGNGGGLYRSVSDRPRVLIDGLEGVEGRALMTISALNICAHALSQYELEILCCDDPVVAIAAEALAFDHRLVVKTYNTAQSENRWPGAVLYISTRFQDVCAQAATSAYHNATPVLFSLQFPAKGFWDSGLMRNVRAAHDPRILADMILAKLQVGRDNEH